MAGARFKNRISEIGAALVEAAIVTPIIIFLVLALIDASFYFGERTSLSTSTRNAARASSAAGADALADYDSLQAIKSVLGIVPDSDVLWIVVFHAADFNDTISPTCKAGTPVAGSGVGSCNVYTASDFKRPTTDFGTGGWTGDDFWPAWQRDDHRTSADYVGVYIHAKCMCIAEVFHYGNTVDSQSILRLEPKQDG